MLVIVQVGAVIAWWRAEGGTPAWGAMCMIAALALSAGDGLAYIFATQAYSGRLVGEPHAARRPVRDPRPSAS